MIARALSRLLLLMGLAGLCLVAGCAAARPPAAAALPAGPAMIVVAPDPVPPADQASEAYGDWAAYLEDFAASKPAGLAIVRMATARWRTLAPAAPRDPYATIFVRRDGSALVHAGKLVDPIVYPAGAAWAAGGTPGGLADMGLTPLSPAPRR